MSTGQKIILQPNVLQWARQRANLSRKDLALQLGIQPERVAAWECSGKISFAQIDKLAARTHTPLGFLFLPEPPGMGLPIADFRSHRGMVSPQPSPELLDTVLQMQRRQWWMQEELQDAGASPLAFVGSCALDATPEAAAAKIRDVLHLDADWASTAGTWSQALGCLRDKAEAAGVLVVTNGIVENNTHRKLDPHEFQGFALADAYAPLIFVNGTDCKTSQIFTLIHEFTHLLVSESGVSRWDRLPPVPNDVEQFCNRAAAEFLVPKDQFLLFWRDMRADQDPYQEAARHFRVSSLVAARQALDLDLIDKDTFRVFCQQHASQVSRDTQTGQSGGDFWAAQKLRIGFRFAAAVVRAVYEGRLPYREAYALTGLHGATFDNLADKLDIPL